MISQYLCQLQKHILNSKPNRYHKQIFKDLLDSAYLLRYLMYDELKYNTADRYIFKVINEMIKPTASFKTIPLHQSLKDKKPKDIKQESTVKVNWLIQRSSLSRDSQSKQSLGAKNQKGCVQSIYAMKERQKNIKCYLHKQITLISNMQRSKEKQNRNHFIKNLEDSSQGIRSQKASCEKKQKLSIMSKRPSLRKINDFISFPTDQHQQTNKPLPLPQDQYWNGVTNIQNQLQAETRRDGQARKKCIRISVRRRALGQVNKN